MIYAFERFARNVMLVAAGAALASGGTLADVSSNELAAAVAADLEQPVRPGGVNGRPFWNGNGRGMRFIYPPAFGFDEVPGAAQYRFTVMDDLLNEHVFEQNRPTADLSPVWKSVPVGFVHVRVEGLSAEGRVLGVSGTRRFWRCAPYEPGAYPKKPWSYAECVRRYYPVLFAHQNTQHFLKHGTPDGVTDLLNIYPSKMNSALVRGLLRYARLSKEHAADALKAAKAAGDFMISISQPDDAPLAHFPPTYRNMENQTSNFANRQYAGQNMLVYPAVMGQAYLELYAACGETRYLKAARGIADTYARLQLPEGTWYLKMWERDGRPVANDSGGAPVRLNPINVCSFMDSLAEATGERRWHEVSARAFAYIEKGPLTTWDWSAQFEDTAPSSGYRNPASSDAMLVARYLLKRFPLDGARRAQARELMRWVEDQFVFWRKPCRADGRSVLSGPDRGFNPWERPGEPAGRKFAEWVDVPGVAEKYTWMVMENSLAAMMMSLYLDFYRLEGDQLCRAKAKTLGDSIVRVQQMCGDGEIASEWFASYMTGTRCPHIWLNCSVNTITLLEDAASVDATPYGNM